MYDSKILITNNNLFGKKIMKKFRIFQKIQESIIEYL